MSILKVNSIEPANAGSEDYFLTKAWVNFNGTGTVAIRADGNVSSITDNGTGDFTVNLSSALTDANFAAYGGAGFSSTDPYRQTDFYVSNTSSARTQVHFGQNSDADAELVMMAFTR